MDALDGVDFIQGDFREEMVLEQLFAVLQGAPVNLVMSDMAPNMSGNKGVDLPRAIYLGELALDAAKTVLSKDGSFLVKLFHGEGFESFHNEVQRHFSKVVIRKPKASRSRSNEVYILAKGFK
jgi:23S rRNA (uridine2552-2'-O)-methyltransferase